MAFSFNLIVTQETTIDSPFTALPCEPRLESWYAKDTDELYQYHEPQDIKEVSDEEYSLWYQRMFL